MNRIPRRRDQRAVEGISPSVYQTVSETRLMATRKAVSLYRTHPKSEGVLFMMDQTPRGMIRNVD
jgi:hypothetical protein